MKRDDKNRRHDLNRQLYAEYQAGDAEALRELIRVNRNIAFNLFQKYRFISQYYNDLDENDIQQCCLIALWRGVISWDPERGGLYMPVKWYAQKEIREITLNRLRGDETSLDAPLKTEGEIITLYDAVADPGAIDPARAVGDLGGCIDFFDYLEENHNPEPADLNQLKAYVYHDWPPHDSGVFQRIRAEMWKHTKSRGFLNRWLDERVSLYRSPVFDRTGGRPGGHSDPVLDAVLRHERLEKKIVWMLGNAIMKE